MLLRHWPNLERPCCSLNLPSCLIQRNNKDAVLMLHRRFFFFVSKNTQSLFRIQLARDWLRRSPTLLISSWLACGASKYRIEEALRSPNRWPRWVAILTLAMLKQWPVVIVGFKLLARGVQVHIPMPVAITLNNTISNMRVQLPTYMKVVFLICWKIPKYCKRIEIRTGFTTKA